MQNCLSSGERFKGGKLLVCLSGYVENMGGFSGPRGQRPGPATHSHCCGAEPAGWFSSSDAEGEKEKCSPSLALLPKLNAIPLAFAFHAFGEPCLKWETRQKSRVREKHGSRARHTYPPSKVAERTLSALPQHLPSPQHGCKRPQWDFN